MDINQNLGNLMKEAQKMQERMQAAQQQLSELTVIGESGGGLVKVTMTGRHEVTAVQIKPSLMEEEPEMLEDLLVAAFEKARQKVEEASRAKIGELTAGLQVPPFIQEDKIKDEE